MAAGKSLQFGIANGFFHVFNDISSHASITMGAHAVDTLTGIRYTYLKPRIDIGFTKKNIQLELGKSYYLRMLQMGHYR